MLTTSFLGQKKYLSTHQKKKTFPAKKHIAAQIKKLDRQNRAVRAQKLFNLIPIIKCTCNCNYHPITTNKNSLREEKYAFENQQKMASIGSQSFSLNYNQLKNI